MLRFLKTIFVIGFGFALHCGIAATPIVVVIPVTGAIGPASADFINRHILLAQKSGAQLIVLQMDTPGGLDISMRQIIQLIVQG